MTPPLIDRAVLDELFEAIGPDGGRSVIEVFIKESRGYVAAIAEGATPAADTAQRDRARRAAHSLKSGAGQIGAAALSAVAREVEGAVEAGAADLSSVATSLEDYAAKTFVALAEFLAPQ